MQGAPQGSCTPLRCVTAGARHGLWLVVAATPTVLHTRPAAAPLSVSVSLSHTHTGTRRPLLSSRTEMQGQQRQRESGRSETHRGSV
jgi:hypothetical protein